MDYAGINEVAARHRLEIFGGFQPRKGDRTPSDTATLLMLGPLEPSFWEHVTKSDEFLDGMADPLDRWSKRTIGQIAEETNARALFPFGGPPWLPFYSWAIRTGRCWTSPVQFLVHDKAGLWVSYRGALAFSEHIKLPNTPSCSPCLRCHSKPCTSSCPVDALNENGYDSGSCISYFSSSTGVDCLDNGCAVRRSCPVSASYSRSPKQSRFHQEALLSQRSKK